MITTFLCILKILLAEMPLLFLTEGILTKPATLLHRGENSTHWEETQGPVAITHHRAVHADFPHLLPTHLLARPGKICWKGSFQSTRSRPGFTILHHQPIFIHPAKTRKAGNFLSARMTGWQRPLQKYSVPESEKHGAEKGWREGEERKEKVMTNVRLTRPSIFVQDLLCYGQTGQWRCQKAGLRGKGRAGVGKNHAGYEPHFCAFCLLPCHWQQIS